jgi:hypothetical protein
MKKIIFILTIIATSFATQAQELAPDQNPNYKTSMEKYAATQVGLQSTNNTTIQSTYKAYDWSTAKAERKAERRNFRRERALYNNYNNGWDYGWNNNLSNNWNNGWNNNYYGRNGRRNFRCIW